MKKKKKTGKAILVVSIAVLASWQDGSAMKIEVSAGCQGGSAVEKRIEPLVRVDFNDSVPGEASLQNRGALGGTFIVDGDFVFSPEVPPPHDGRGFSGRFTAGGDRTRLEFRDMAALESLNGLRSFTMTAWVKGPFPGLASIMDNNPSNFGYRWLVDAGRMILKINEHQVQIPVSLPQDEWVFLAVSFDAAAISDQVRFYAGNGDELGQVGVRTVLANRTATHEELIASYGEKAHRGPRGKSGEWAFLYVGANRHLGLERRLHHLDNARIYGSQSDGRAALSRDELEAVMREPDVDIGEPGDDLLFWASFDDGFEPDTQAGDGTSRLFGEPRLTEGRQGGALEIRSGHSGVAYPLPGNLRPDRGTIAFWISAVDWDGEDQDVAQMIWATTGVNRRLQVQHSWFERAFHFLPLEAGQSVLPLPGALRGGARAPLAPDDLVAGFDRMMPGIWYHVAFTWQDGILRSFVNGLPEADVAAPDFAFSADSDVGTAFVLGHGPSQIFIAPEGTETSWQPLLEKGFTTRLDDVVIFNRPLHSTEIAHLHMLGVRDFLAANLGQASQAQAQPAPTSGFVRFDLVSGPELHQIGRAELLVRNRDVATIEKRIPLTITERSTAITVDMNGMAPGTYTYQLLLYDLSDQLLSFSPPGVSFVWPEAEPWWNNKIGLDDMVLPPWTPMIRQEDGFNVWEREIRFDGFPLPAQIRARGEDLLAGPANLSLSVSGQPRTFSNGRVRYEQTSDARIVREWSATAEGVKLIVRSEAEFDGFIWTTVRVESQGEERVDGLTLAIPLRAEHATFIHTPGRSPDYPEPGIHFWTDQPFVHPFDTKTGYVWLGDYERGLQWTAESREGWQNRDRADEIRVFREGDVVWFEVKMVDSPHRQAAFETGFALLPTPVRPPVLRSRRRGEIGISSCPWPAAGYAPRPAIGSDMDDAAFWGNMRELLVRRGSDMAWRRYGDGADPIRPREFMYSYIASQPVRYKRNFFEQEVREYTWYGQEWRVIPDRNRLHPLFSYQSACPASSYTDWWIWEIANRIVHPDYADWKGIYFDHGTSPTYCSNPLHGCGFEDEDGSWTPQLKIRDMRRLLRRVSMAVKGVDAGNPHGRHPDYPVVVHMSGVVNMAYLSFVDFLYDGENIEYSRNRLNGGYFSDVLTWDFMAVEWNPLAYGYNERGTHHRFDYIMRESGYEIPGVQGLPGTGLGTPNHWQQYLSGIGRGDYPKTEQYDAIIEHVISRERDVNGVFLQFDRTPHHFSLEAGFEPEIKRLVGIQNEFGFYEDDVEFIGFWRNEDWIEGQTDHLKVAVYRRQTAGEALLVLSNNQDEPFNGMLRMDIARLGVGDAVRVWDAESDELFAESASGWMEQVWTVPGRNYRLLRISKKN